MDDDSGAPLAQTSTALIRYPRFKALHRDIRECQEMSRLCHEPHCLSLEGVTGAGKSTLVRDYAALFPRQEEAEGTRIPIFYAETPSPATVKGMAVTMLARLGDPAAHRGTLWSMNFRLTRLLRACQVELVILDDFHHLIDTETNRVLEQVSDWLKVLIKETGIPFVVVSIAGRGERILEANTQLSRLFALRQTLEPFACDRASEASVQEFACFVEYAEQAIGTPLPATLPRLDLVYRLHAASRGIVGNLMNLLRYAAWLARQRNQTAITLPLLATAFDRRLARHLKASANPFTVSCDERTADKPQTASTDDSPARRPRRTATDAGG